MCNKRTRVALHTIMGLPHCQVESTAIHLSYEGKLFQALGPVPAKDRWPSPVATRGTSLWPCCADRRFALLRSNVAADKIIFQLRLQCSSSASATVLINQICPVSKVIATNKWQLLRPTMYKGLQINVVNTGSLRHVVTLLASCDSHAYAVRHVIIYTVSIKQYHWKQNLLNLRKK